MRAGIPLAARDAGRSLAVSSDSHRHEHVAVLVFGVGVSGAQCGKRACARRRRTVSPRGRRVGERVGRKGYDGLLTIFYWSSGTTPRWPGLGSERSLLYASLSLSPLLAALRDRPVRHRTLRHPWFCGILVPDQHQLSDRKPGKIVNGVFETFAISSVRHPRYNGCIHGAVSMTMKQRATEDFVSI